MTTRKSIRERLGDWGLKENPFKEDTSPLEVWAGSDEQLEYLKYILENVSDQKGMATFLLAGDYGSGKTYHLLHLASYVDTKLKGLGIYFKFTSKARKRGFQEILEGLVKAIGSERIIEIGNDILKKRKIGSLNQRTQLLDALEDFEIERDLRFAIANMTLKEDYSMTWAWLKGGATDAQSRSLSMMGNPRDESTALEVVVGLIDFLSLKYSFVAVFIDELENLRGTSTSAQSTREGLRDLYDMLLTRERKTGVAVIFAATATMWRELVMTLRGALRDRLDEEIPLSTLTLSDSEEFVKDLFRFFREDKTDTISPPFENEGAFKHFIEVASQDRPEWDERNMGVTGSPRRIIKLGKLLIRRSCSKNLDMLSISDIDSILLAAVF